MPGKISDVARIQAARGRPPPLSGGRQLFGINLPSKIEVFWSVVIIFSFHQIPANIQLSGDSSKIDLAATRINVMQPSKDIGEPTCEFCRGRLPRGLPTHHPKCILRRTHPRSCPQAPDKESNEFLFPHCLVWLLTDGIGPFDCKMPRGMSARMDLLFGFTTSKASAEALPSPNPQHPVRGLWRQGPRTP